MPRLNANVNTFVGVTLYTPSTGFNNGDWYSTCIFKGIRYKVQWVNGDLLVGDKSFTKYAQVDSSFYNLQGVMLSNDVETICNCIACLLL